MKESKIYSARKEFSIDKLDLNYISYFIHISQLSEYEQPLPAFWASAFTNYGCNVIFIFKFVYIMC